MSEIKEGTLLWEPSEKRKQQSNIYHYMNWLKEHKNKTFNDYHTLWKWSVEELEDFWTSIWEYFDIQAKQPYETVLTSHEMPGAKWFPEATINYAEHVFRNWDDNEPAIIHASELRGTEEVTWQQLYRDTSAMQQTMKNSASPRATVLLPMWRIPMNLSWPFWQPQALVPSGPVHPLSSGRKVSLTASNRSNQN